MQFRIEHDLLGEKQISEEAYYGINAQRAMENFVISDRTINDVPVFIKAMAKNQSLCFS